MKKIKAILFDHDGTLVDSEYVHYEMWATILKSYGINLTESDYIHNYAGIPTPTNAVLIVEKYALKIPPSYLIKSKASATESFLQKQAFPLMAGAQDSIGFFKEKEAKLAIVTGAGREGVDVTINSNDLHNIFQTIVSGDDVANSKPFPDCYLLAAKNLGVDVSECIAIEDSENGVKAAVSAGVPCVSIATPMSIHHDLSQSMKTFKNLNDATLWITENYIVGNA